MVGVIKDYILVIPNYAVSYPVIFRHMKDGTAKVGVNRLGEFEVNGVETTNIKGLCRWINSLGVENPDKRVAKMQFSPEKYPVYDNFPEARECGRSKDVPYDYNGILGVPTSYMDNQIEGFEIIGMLEGCFAPLNDIILGNRPILNGKNMFTRILIQKK